MVTRAVFIKRMAFALSATLLLRPIERVATWEPHRPAAVFVGGENASDDNDGLTAETPFASLKRALDAGGGAAGTKIHVQHPHPFAVRQQDPLNHMWRQA